MQEREAGGALADIFDRLALRSGDCVMLGIDMGRVPLPAYAAPLTRDGFRERERRWCAFVLDRLLDRLGPTGTLLVPAFSYSRGAPGSVFDRETTPAEVGPFTEFFRARPGVLRSTHPIFSVAGIGRDAAAILGGTGRAAFGASSPFARLAAHGTRFLCLGVELRASITYVHHLEQSYGCPHRYHKSFDTKVMVEGREVPGPWYAYVAYRGIGHKSDITSLQQGLLAEGALAEAPWNERPNHLADIDAVDRVGYRLLSANPSAFVDEPLAFTFEELPATDGAPRQSTLIVRARVEA